MSLLAAPLLLTVLMPAEASGFERRLWEVAVRKFEQEDAQTVFPEDSVLFYGSSSIRRWRSIEEDMAPRPVIQRGYGGARISDAVDFVERVIAPHTEADAIVVFIANDIDGRANQPTPAEVGELAAELLSRVRQSHPATPVIWVETTPSPTRWDLWPMIAEANRFIESACDADGYADFLPTARLFLADGRPDETLFIADGIHLNDEGYAEWSASIRRALDRRLGPPNRQTPSDEPLLVSTQKAITEPKEAVATISSDDEPVEIPVLSR